MTAYAATAMRGHTYEAQGAEIARTCFTCHHRLRKDKRQARETLETTAKGRSANKDKQPNHIQDGDAAPKLRKLNGVHVALQAHPCPNHCSTRLHKPAKLDNAANNPMRDNEEKPQRESQNRPWPTACAVKATASNYTPDYNGTLAASAALRNVPDWPSISDATRLAFRSRCINATAESKIERICSLAGIGVD